MNRSKQGRYGYENSLSFCWSVWLSVQFHLAEAQQPRKFPGSVIWPAQAPVLTGISARTAGSRLY